MVTLCVVCVVCVMALSVLCRVQKTDNPLVAIKDTYRDFSGAV